MNKQVPRIDNRSSKQIRTILKIYADFEAGNSLMHLSRQRRTPFTIVGTIANSLYDVLDLTYSEDMTKTITKIKGFNVTSYS